MIKAGFGNGHGVRINADACTNAQVLAQQALTALDGVDVGQWNTSAARQFQGKLDSVRSAVSGLVDQCSQMADSAWTCEWYRLHG